MVCAVCSAGHSDDDDFFKFNCDSIRISLLGFLSYRFPLLTAVLLLFFDLLNEMNIAANFLMHSEG